MYVKLIRAQWLNIHTTENVFLYNSRPHRENKDITDVTERKAMLPFYLFSWMSVKSYMDLSDFILYSKGSCISWKTYTSDKRF